MSNTPFSFPFFQLLMTQIFHDMISPMSALTTGMSFLCSLKGQSLQEEASLVTLVDTARQQLQHRMVFFRALVGKSDHLSQEDLMKEIGGYLQEYKMSIGTIPASFSAGVFTGLCCWLCQQFSGPSLVEGATSEKGTWTFTAHGPLRNLESSEDFCVMEGTAPRHPKESYGYYLHYLAAKEGLSVEVQRINEQTLSIVFS